MNKGLLFGHDKDKPKSTTVGTLIRAIKLDDNSYARCDGETLVNKPSLIAPKTTIIIRSTPLAQAEPLVGLTWNGSIFCAISNNFALVSTNGISWASNPMPNVITSWSSVAWNGSVFLAAANSITTSAATSTDGITWTARTLPSSRAWSRPVACNSKFFIVGASTTAIASSTDGISWSEATLPVTALTPVLSVFGNTMVISHIATTMMISQDAGDTWISITPQAAATNNTNIAFNGKVYCRLGTSSVVGVGNIILLSTDLLHWEVIFNPFTTPYTIAWNGEVFCAIAQRVIMTSPDGYTWTVRDIPHQSSTTASNGGTIVWNGSIFCATLSGTTSGSGGNKIATITIDTKTTQLPFIDTTSAKPYLRIR